MICLVIIAAFFVQSSAVPISNSLDDGTGQKMTATDEPALAICPEFWVLGESGEKCYFITTSFITYSFSEATTFCHNLGAKLVEPLTMQQFEEVNNLTESTDEWTYGPWVGLIRPFGDKKIIGFSGANVDAELTTYLSATLLEHDSNSQQNCAGYAPEGSGFKFWTCNLPGNPVCEMAVVDDMNTIESQK